MRYLPVSPGKCDRKAVTLVELLVVIAILLVLFSLLVAAIQRIRAAAARTACSNNLHQIGIALQSYHDTNKSLPHGMSRRSDRMPFLAWSARILPHLDQTPLWNATEAAYAATKQFESNPPHVGLSTRLSVFLCPLEIHTVGSGLPEIPVAAVTNYFGVSHGKKWYDGVLFPESAMRLTDISDGISQTLAAGERSMAVDGAGEYRFGWWYGGIGQLSDGSLDYLLGVRETRSTYRTPTCKPGPYHFGPGRADNPCDLFHHWSYHPGGAHFLMCDGSVHFLSYSADAILPALATRSGNEAVELP